MLIGELLVLVLDELVEPEELGFEDEDGLEDLFGGGFGGELVEAVLEGAIFFSLAVEFLLGFAQLLFGDEEILMFLKEEVFEAFDFVGELVCSGNHVAVGEVELAVLCESDVETDDFAFVLLGGSLLLKNDLVEAFDFCDEDVVAMAGVAQKLFCL